MSAGTTASMNASSDGYPMESSIAVTSAAEGPVWRDAKRSGWARGAGGVTVPPARTGSAATLVSDTG
jgi:hypothetical protein